MNEKVISGLKFAKKAYKKFLLPDYTEMNWSFRNYEKQAASDVIKKVLEADKPACIARFGSTELKVISNYYSIQHYKGNFLSYIQHKIEPYWWDDEYVQDVCTLAGFFPASTTLIAQFAELMIADMKEVDVLGSWLNNEKFFAKELKNAVKIGIEDLQPYHHENPWSEALKGKKVLVVHPFENSIRSQYARRELLFKDQRILPEFELRTLKAVQSIALNETPFGTWFEALDFMKEKIDKMDFDIAILGCGAYGFPLAAHIKRMGKKAIHMGGATQVLFGIMGKRWEEEAGNDYINKNFKNEYWIRPSTDEIPKRSDLIEGGCYW